MDLQNINQSTVIGKVTQELITALGYGHNAGNIIVGPTNVAHMQSRHPSDFVQYGHCIEDIVQNPDYVGVNPNDGSIQFIKQYADHVLVGVRVTSSGTYFARSLYVISEQKFNSYLNAGRLIQLP